VHCCGERVEQVADPVPVRRPRLRRWLVLLHRDVPLLLSRSWLGKEDHGLEPDLRAELPGVLNWALDGLKRLAEHDRFTRPPGADEALVTLQDLASPVAAFVRDRCNRNPKHEVAVDTLYTAYRSWTDDNGRVKSTKQVFGRDLRAAVPGVRVSQIGPIEDRTRVYRGVGLQPEKRGE
jgi:putative DNA primase/helicase